MEQLKVRRRETIVLNMIIYLILSFLFVYIQYAYRHHLSPFSLPYLKKSLELFWYIALVLGISSLMIFKYSSWALFFFQVSTLLVSFKVLEGLFISFNKIIVLALFCHVVISYFLSQLYRFHLTSACLNPNYRRSDLFSPLLKVISCEVQIDDNVYIGSLSNWDEEGCFIRLNMSHSIPKKVSVKIHFYDREFVQNGEVVAEALDFTGIGVKFEKRPKDLNVFNWAEFIELVQELGFQPERLR